MRDPNETIEASTAVLLLNSLDAAARMTMQTAVMKNGKKKMT